jgi:CubicO group peptidase (beta-lactamase class C family)
MSLPNFDPWWRAVCADLDAGAAPAAACVIRRGPRTLFAGCHGWATTLPQPEPLRPCQRFDLASVTKAVATTTLALSLWQDGDLDLDALLSAAAPALLAPGHALGGLTPRLLLTHQSGLPACGDFYRRCPDRAAVRAAVLATPLERDPGSEAVYSDVGFLLLGFVLERLAGRRLDELFAERLARPLGLAAELGYGPIPLADAVATEVCAWRGRLVRGEVHDENARACDHVAGHAGLFGTAGALAEFGARLLAGQILAPATLAEMLRPRADVAAGRFHLGWKRFDYESGDPRCFGHDGFTGTLLWLSPANDLTVVLLTNRVHPSRANRRLNDLRPGWLTQAVALARA